MAGPSHKALLGFIIVQEGIELREINYGIPLVAGNVF